MPEEKEHDDKDYFLNLVKQYIKEWLDGRIEVDTLAAILNVLDCGRYFKCPDCESIFSEKQGICFCEIILGERRYICLSIRDTRL